jgi:2-polyprenyl-3-methyl-5-hydroxy-6-metoxy-1,4-benzoquinol methylase
VAEALAYCRRNVHYLLPSHWSAAAKAIYRRFSRSGIFVTRDELGMCSLHPVQQVNTIVAVVKPKSVLDVGCGTGQTTGYLADRGLEVLGLEASRVAIRHGTRPDLVRFHDLRRPLDLGRQFDLVWCFEVAEHIHPRFVDVFVDTLAKHSRVVAMSAAPPGQGGEGHFNEQPKSYWVEKFAARGFDQHEHWTAALAATGEFYSQNIMVFHKRADTTSAPPDRRIIAHPSAGH